MNREDAELARRAASGESAAAEQLARRHGPAAFGLARALGLGEHDAEDVAQEVLMRLLAMLERYDPERSSLRTLVHRMTANAVTDHRRRSAGRETGWDGAELPASPGARTFSEAAGLPAGEIRRAVLAAAEALPQRQRQVFALHDLEGLPVAEVAAALEISATNVRVNLCAARRALRGRLAQLLEDG